MTTLRVRQSPAQLELALAGLSLWLVEVSLEASQQQHAGLVDAPSQPQPEAPARLRRSRLVRPANAR